jgi:hypothetical protein
MPLSFDGTTWLKIPEDAAGREMRVVLHVSNAKQQAISGIGIVVAPSSAAASAASSAQTASGAPASTAVTMTLSANRAIGGDAVAAILHGAHGDARITLTDNAGSVVEQGDVPAGQDAVSLATPSVRTATTNYVVANVAQGSAQESLVQKLVVAPASVTP